MVKEIKDTNTVSSRMRRYRANGEPYMVAMTMDFDVKNTNDLTGLAPNDQVTFSMIVTEDDGWIETCPQDWRLSAGTTNDACRPGR